MQLRYDSGVREEAAEWLRIADHDIAAAEGLARLKLWPGAAYFCQQAAEKLLKALLMGQQREPPKTHDLLELADVAGIELSQEQRLFLTRLSDHAVRSRYPGTEYTEAQVQQVFEETKRFFEWLRAKLT